MNKKRSKSRVKKNIDEKVSKKQGIKDQKYNCMKSISNFYRQYRVCITNA